MRILLVVASLIAAAFLVLAASPVERGIQQVEVVNFPEVQRFKGDFDIKGPIAHSQLLRREKVVVPPVGRQYTTELIQADPALTDGFTDVVLNLEGEIKSDQFTPGAVGAVLLPDDEPVLRAFKEEGQWLFPLEITARPSPAGPRTFSAETVRTLIGFPRYRIYFYNETDHTAELTLYLYLTH